LSWFKRKPKNRRLGREHVLDVKLRSSQVRAARTRMAAVALGSVFATIFGLYVLWRAGERALDRLVYENAAFAIAEIDVQTDGSIAVEQLRRWMGVRQGQNLFALDLARVKRDLELVSLIDSVSVERILPRTLRVRVSEREPLAVVNVPRPRTGGGVEMALYHIDLDGVVIVPLDNAQRATPLARPEQLPVLTGVSANDVQPGRRIENPQVQGALQLIVAFEHSPMVGLADLKSIDVSSPEVVVVTTGQGSEVTFGLTELEQQLRRWHSVFEAGQRAGKAIATLDLAVNNNVPARWLEASAVPPVTPRLPKPYHSKKKHV
jgi:cell division septal protein FtsQ